jgi:hypothetical protein
VRGIPFEPCFNVDRTDAQSFRGSVSGLSFAYCDFTHRGPRKPSVVRTTHRPSQPVVLISTPLRWTRRPSGPRPITTASQVPRSSLVRS